MFSVVAFKTLDISQGSVATHLRCGGIFSDSICVAIKTILNLALKFQVDRERKKERKNTAFAIRI